MSHSDKRDSNEAAIINAFRAAGWYVQQCDRDAGHDLNVFGHNHVFIVEVKDGAKPPSARQLTDAEKKFKGEIEARGIRLWVLLDVDDATHLVNGEYDKIPERKEYHA